MKIVLGLGNPGERYAATRHNVGWMVLDALAATLRCEFKPGRGEYFEAVGTWLGTDLRLVKPTTYMNGSGVAARQVLERYDLEPASMLVIVDEIQLPVGRIRIRPSGSSGGHNGLESMIYQLETDQFPRLRCGVGNAFERGRMVEYVLSPFDPAELDLVTSMIENSRAAALDWVDVGTEKAMQTVNRAVSEGDDGTVSGEA